MSAALDTATAARSGKGHNDENFPVASHLIHPRHRPAILAFYNYVRAGDDIAGMVGRKPPTVNLPRGVVYPIAFFAELAARVTGKQPFATIDGIRMSRYRMFFSDAKARAELGYTARPYREGLSDAIAWFRQAGYLR